MKKITKQKATLLLSSLLLASASFATAADTKTTTGKLGAVSDGNGGCKSGLGMCDLKTQIVGAEFTMNWQISGDLATLNMFISDEMMTEVPTDIVASMEQGHFVMQSGYAFPSDVSELIAPGTDLIVVPAGTYSVTHESQGYTVHFILE